MRIVNLRGFAAWLLASLFFAYQYSVRILPAILNTEIMEHFGVNASRFGEFNGAYYIAYVVAHIPIGLLIDRLGLRFMLSACILLSSISQLTILSDSFTVAILGRVLNGIASSAGIIAVVKVITMAYSSNKFSLALGFSITIGLFGSISANMVIYPLYKMFGMQHIIYLLAFVGIAMSLLSAIVLPKFKDDELKLGWIENITTLFKADKVWILIALMGGLMIGAVEGFADAWSAKFIASSYNISADLAVKLTSLMFFTFALGGPILGIIDKTLKINQLILLIIIGVIMCISMLSILFPYDPGNLYILSALLCLVGFCFPFQTLVLNQAISRLPKSLSALAGASSNMIMMGFGPLYHLLIGYSTDFLWDEKYDNGGNPVYGAETLSASLSVIPAGTALAILGLLLIYLKLHRKIA